MSDLQIKKKRKTGLGDYYWAHADILRGFGVPAATYDQRILAFMAIKLLIDNKKLKFNFNYNDQFGLSETDYLKYKGKDTKATFRNLLNDLPNLGKNLNYFDQDTQYNPGKETSILAYINHPKVFPINSYIDELPENHYLEMILDVYTEKGDFSGYPKEQYKDLYEKTVARMKTKFEGDLTGQHFTQKSIIHLMCEVALKELEGRRHIAIYDPACGTGSMIMESAFYFKKQVKNAEIEVFGQEISGQIWLLSKIFLEICQLPDGQQGIANIIAYGNTLTQPAFSEKINGDDSFDFIIANPPFGVDWKQDFDEVVRNMASDQPNFLVVQDGKKYITPKKSDGQFLFMMHIIKLMKEERVRGKRALAAIISSSTLISTGSATGAESKIRRKIFSEGIVKGVLEQPNAMFTNTDIATHVWFLDNALSTSLKLVRAQNEEQPYFIPHPKPQDKMRNAYSSENIKHIVNELSYKRDKEWVSKTIKVNGQHALNIANEVGRKETINDIDLDDLEVQINNQLKELTKMMGNNE